MARNPNAIQKINYIVDFIFDPCDAPFTLYIETLWPALLQAFIEYYAIDLIQIATGFASPRKALGKRRGGTHSSRKRGRGKPRTRIGAAARWLAFDPWDELGKRAQMPLDMAGRQTTRGVTNLWIAYGVLQRLMYWVMVFEITTNFFYNWFSGVARTRFCQHQGRAFLVATGPQFIGSGLIQPWPFGAPDIQKARGLVSWNVASGTIGGYGGTMVASAAIRPHPLAGPGFTCRMAIWRTDTGQEFLSPEYDPEEERMSVTIAMSPGVTYSVGIFANDLFIADTPSVYMAGNYAFPP